MPIEIRMPALSPTMTEGNLARWLKKEGDEVHSGDVIAEIETDKATMEYEAVDEGRIGKIIVPEGSQGVKVNEPIALLLEEGEDDAALSGGGAAAKPEAPKAEAKSAPPTPVAPKTEPAPAPKATANGSGQPAGHPEAAAGGGRVFASPLARRMAHHAGINLSGLRGSGPQGRIVKADIDRALAQGGTQSAAQPAATRPTPTPTAPQPQVAPAAASPPTPAPAAGAAVFAKAQVLALAGNPPYSEKPHSGMRRVIARRLAESKATVPHFYLTVDCTIDELLKTRTALNAKTETKISVNDFVIRAAALALRQVPAANASWSDDAILQWERVDMAIAVALDDGLITPIIKGADQKGLAQIAAETKDLAARARSGKLKLEEFQGGTFSISNLGMFGIREFSAVINPPHGCILAVGAGEQRPVVRNGELAIATVMSCTISCDHRVVDGATGAQFMAAFKKLIEDPLTMLL
ncbi:MAG: pyruvate dehydrogenase complex dihydrolipoamide acetyltransferase [Alphaproteobacteria bacterium]|nr:pyruvate dehydrogenase complex dihydrolipoamide acetyltransferase [Alphaproteobacteria bacterium]